VNAEGGQGHAEWEADEADLEEVPAVGALQLGAESVRRRLQASADLG